MLPQRDQVISPKLKKNTNVNLCDMFKIKRGESTGDIKNKGARFIAV